MRRILALLVAIGGLAEIGAQFVIAWRVPSEDEWKAAAKYVRASMHPGDGIVFAPEWVDSIGRLYLGDLVTVEEAARPDRARQGRIWEISTRGAEHPEARGRVAETRIFGRVRVRRIERRTETALFDFTEAAPERARVGEVGFRPYLCIHASAPDTIEFADVPMGNRVAVGGGIHDYLSRYRNDAPVTLEMEFDGRRIFSEEFGNDGWRRITVDTRAFAGRRGNVRFRIDAKKVAARTFCFHAEVHR